MKHFTFSFVFTAVALALVGMWGFHLNGVSGALAAVTLAAVLAAMEVSLSFDNAVVNAGVLKTMNHFWRMMFLTVGILVAVLNQVLSRAGREEQAMMTTLAGLVVVMMMLVRQISDLFQLVKSLFGL